MEHRTLKVRVGHRTSKNGFILLHASSADDREPLQSAAMESIKDNPDDPLVIAIDGYAPWLDDLLDSCIEMHRSSPANVAREVISSQVVQLPQSADRKASQVPWTFIVDQINLPEVWRWTFGRSEPKGEHASSINNYRFRIGAWVCDQGGYKLDSQIPVVLIFTRSTAAAEDIVTNLVFPHIIKAAILYDDRAADNAVCWVFYSLYNLLTDWQNVIGEVGRKLNQAEIDSDDREIPIKTRTRSLHKEVDRMYELHDYLRFHSRCFKKLAKFTTVDASENKHGDSIWEVMDDTIGDLEQYETYLDSMKERFNNLIELQFNIESATQSDNARFISILGSLFLPVSFVASIFGISSVRWAPIYYLYVAAPLFVVSVLLTFLYPVQLARQQNQAHPIHIKRIRLQKEDFTMLGNITPEGQEASVLRYADAHSLASSNSSIDKHSEHSPLAVSFKTPDRPAAHRMMSDRKSRARTTYGVPKTSGLVGSRRKEMDDEEVRRERARKRELDVERLGSLRRRSKSEPVD